MPQVIKDVKTVTEDGELKITLTLELNINVNQSNQIEPSFSVQKSIETKVEEKKKEEDEFLIPDFSSDEKVSFGKNV
jgi:hypothetical protein